MAALPKVEPLGRRGLFVFRRLFANMPSNPLKGPSFYILFLIIAAVGVTFVPAVYADSAFAEKYRAYQAEVRAGKEAFDKKDYQAAIEHYSKAVGMSPFEAMLYFNRGLALYKSEKLKDAEEDFDKTLILDPRMVNALSYQGLCREKLGKEKAAIEDYIIALQQKLDDVSMQNNLAWLYATAKDEEVRDKLKALEHASKASALSKEKNAGVLDTLARVYFINGKVKEAIETEKKAIVLEPNNNEFKKNLAIYERESKKQ
jgi:tetratricopeptide (TPR) repeat protein